MEKPAIELAAAALADQGRLAVVQALAGAESLSFGAVQEVMGLSQSCVSHHVKLLTDSGLVESERQGRTVQLRLNRAAMSELAGFLAALGGAGTAAKEAAAG